MNDTILFFTDHVNVDAVICNCMVLSCAGLYRFCPELLVHYWESQNFLVVLITKCQCLHYLLGVSYLLCFI